MNKTITSKLIFPSAFKKKTYLQKNIILTYIYIILLYKKI